MTGAEAETVLLAEEPSKEALLEKESYFTEPEAGSIIPVNLT